MGFNNTRDEKMFVAGLWYGIEQLVANGDHYSAENILLESGIKEWEFRDNLEDTQYMYNELSEFLDKVFEEK